MNINKTKLIAAITPIITLVLGYYGYQPIQELKAPSTDVDIEVIVPEQTSNGHSHQQHSHKDWLPVIQQEIEKAQRAHINEDH